MNHEDPDGDKLIYELSKLSEAAYQRQRKDAARELGMRVDALDKIIRHARAKAEENAALPHWNVEPWETEVAGAKLLNDIERMFRRYIVLPKGAAEALALWDLHAWTMDAGDVSPFMVLVSPTKRCGKTSALIVLYYITPRSELASNISPSAMFRYIEDVRPTLLIDEADSFLKDNEELRGILNSGHTKAAANVIRNVEVNGQHKPRRFSTWAPKAIATIRDLADTLEDRSIIITLQRKPKTAAVERLRKRDSEEFATLRRKAARWAADNFDKLKDPEPAIPDALNDRAADNWRPLLAIADLAGGDWPRRARDAAHLLSGEQDDSAVNVELLADIRTAFGDDRDEMKSADLVAALVADPERPWAEWRAASHLPRSNSPGCSSRSASPPRRCTLPGSRTGRGTSGCVSRRHGRLIVLVRMPRAAPNPLPKRASVQVPMKWAQVAIFEACKTEVRTDRKTPTYPTAMRVCTLARIETRNLAAKVNLTRTTTASASPTSSCGSPPT